MLSKRGFISAKPLNYSHCTDFEFNTKHDEIKLNSFYSQYYNLAQCFAGCSASTLTVGVEETEIKGVELDEKELNEPELVEVEIEEPDVNLDDLINTDFMDELEDVVDVAKVIEEEPEVTEDDVEDVI